MNATQTGTSTAEATTNPTVSTSGVVELPAELTSLSSGRIRMGSTRVDPPLDSERLERKSPKTRMISLATVALILAAVPVAWYLNHARAWVKTDNAYLAAHIHTISSRVAGTIAEVRVTDNQAVSAGSLLARLDAKDFEVACKQAQAQLAGARARRLEAAARIDQARAQVAREQARATKAQNDFSRANSLFEGGSGAISKQELDLARSDTDAAQAALESANSGQESANASASEARALEQVAEAGLADAELQLSYANLVAPADGRIGKKNLEIGNRVQPGQALLALVQPDIWVLANFKETQLASLRPGQSVRILVDAFPGHKFVGTVESLSPASGSEFALLPPDNATGNFTRIVQRVPVKIVLDRASLGNYSGRLVAGMSAQVEVKVRE
jgi:membrane fusion protein, multidrug efflux system